MVALFGLVITLIFLLFVELPVRIEIPVEVQSTEFEDSLASFQTPASTGDLHAILDHVPASAFDHAGGDGFGNNSNSLTQDLVQDILTGYTLQIAASGAEALRLCSETSPEIC